MLINPFVEGLILIVLGIGCYIGGGLLKMQPLIETGSLLVPLGVGYMGGTAIGKTVSNGGAK